jgi:hypothetical protein
MNKIWGAALVLLISACGDKAEKPTIPEDKMVRIMGDLIVADAATANFSGYQKDSLSQVYYKQVYDMHGITLETYEKNLRIYSNNIEQMEQISKQIEDRFMTEKKGAPPALTK